MILKDPPIEVFEGAKRVVIGHCPRPQDISVFVDGEIEIATDNLPKSAHILIKPNFHKDLPSILGNTTDFRLIMAVVRSLQKRGYRKITIGEGPACGFDYSNIDVFKRLRVTQLADYLGVNLVNFNKAPTTPVQLWNRRNGHIARIVKECDYFINLPKLKTHLLAQISASLKSLVGCFAGLQKREMHYRLLENIIRVNEIVTPDLIFVDALVAMEGQGPGIGTPVVLDRIICGKNPYSLDLACAVLSGQDPHQFKLIQLAVRKGHLQNSDVDLASKEIPCLHHFIQARPNKLVVLSSLPIFNKARDFVRAIYTKQLIHSVLYKLELAEDVLNEDDGDFRVELPSEAELTDCLKCNKYCPLAVENDAFSWPESSKGNCLGCMYCIFLCSENGAHLSGRLGYMQYLIDYYKHLTTKLQ